MPDPRRAMAGCVALLLLTTACNEPDRRFMRFDPGVAPIASPFAASAAYRNTIGELTSIQGTRGMAVRGYGVVVGLGTRGCTTAPRQLFERVVQAVYKHHDFANPMIGSNPVSPEQFLRDPDTAIVLVEGLIPPGAVKGSTFDLVVRSVPGTDTTSLRGGRLYSTDLYIYRDVSTETSIIGKVIAEGRGPLFHNPFSDDKSATRDDPLEAIVLGGGVVEENRRVRLVLSEPSYPFARRIMERINEQFPGEEKVADALSPSFIQINIPPRYCEDHSHFLGLIRALYLTRDPSFGVQRARELSEELRDPDAPHAMISLALEGLGRTALAELELLYGDQREWVSFYAAAAGARLRDHVAADALALHAGKASSPFRYQAIRALGRAEGMANALQALRKLLDDEDPRVRVAAYEELARVHDFSLSTTLVAGDNFYLDIVPTSSEPVIYAKRTGTRRIALFGEGMRLAPPIFYRAPEGEVTIDWPAGEENLTMVRLTPRGALSDRFIAPTGLAELIKFMGSDVVVIGKHVQGAGLDYAQVVRALHRLCADGSINARFVLEEPNAAEIFGPTERRGRKETEF